MHSTTTPTYSPVWTSNCWRYSSCFPDLPAEKSARKERRSRLGRVLVGLSRGRTALHHLLCECDARLSQGVQLSVENQAGGVLAHPLVEIRQLQSLLPSQEEGSRSR